MAIAKRIWGDPVFSQVIAAGIVAAIAFGVAEFSSLQGAWARAIAVVGILALGVALTLVSLKVVSYRRQDFVWTREGYFLGMSARGGTDIRVSSFQLKGRNRRSKPFDSISGYLQSNITNERVPILLESMPLEATNGIPPKCDFWLRALFDDAQSDREGFPAEEFARKFGEFTLHFKYNGKSIEQRFSIKAVTNQIERFRAESNPAPMPTVTRKG